ncbi:MAG: hypothetical protein JWN04_822 [Myxococcaceae bacterium]|nr:hypothetical protein [Myxococcaceae bacterium]
MTYDHRLDAVCSGFPCAALRHPKLGIWTGYIAVHAGHPWHRAEADDLLVRIPGVEITYAGESGRRITPRDAQEGGWVLGFDLGHARDADPTEEPTEALQKCEALAKAAAVATPLDVAPVKHAAVELADSNAPADAIPKADGGLHDRIINIMSRILAAQGFAPDTMGADVPGGYFWAKFATHDEARLAAEALRRSHALECKTPTLLHLQVRL